MESTSMAYATSPSKHYSKDLRKCTGNCKMSVKYSGKKSRLKTERAKGKEGFNEVEFVRGLVNSVNVEHFSARNVGNRREE
jgi:hypothetical protein